MRRAALTLSILLLTLSLTGCEKKPIIIGFSGNLTGTSSEIAIDSMYGAQMAVSKINQANGIKGRPIELIIEDDGETVKTAREADKKLVEKGACAIIGHNISGVEEESFKGTNQDHIVMISPTISSSDFFGLNDYFYTMVTESTYETQYISQFMEKQNYKKIGYLYQLNNETYSRTFVKNTQAPLLKAGFSTAFMEGYAIADKKDFDKTMSLIRNSGIDALVIAGSAYDVAYYAQEMYKYNCMVPIYTSTWAMSEDLISIAGPAAEGIYSINTYDSHSASQSFRDFENDYVQAYGSSPTFAAVYSYEAVMLLAKAIENSDSTSSEDIKKSLDKISVFTGLQEDIKINEFGDAIRQMHLFQVQNQSFVKVDDE